MFSSWTVCAALLILGVQYTRAADNRSDTWVPLDNIRDICGPDGSHSNGQYIFSPNFFEPQGATGWQCMKVGDADRRYNNESAWGVTWNWDDSLSTALHSFPNARLNNGILPAQLSNVNTLWLYAVWTYATGNDTARGMDIDTVASADMVATVVLDVFIDSDRKKAGSPIFA